MTFRAAIEFDAEVTCALLPGSAGDEPARDAAVEVEAVTVDVLGVRLHLSRDQIARLPELGRIEREGMRAWSAAA